MSFDDIIVVPSAIEAENVRNGSHDGDEIDSTTEAFDSLGESALKLLPCDRRRADEVASSS